MNRNKIRKTNSEAPGQSLPSERELSQERVLHMRRNIQRLQQEPAPRTQYRHQTLDFTFTREQTWAVPKPPPGVVPADQQMALDSALDNYGQWAMSYSIFEEGQAFLGYPYLSELSQRPEYRVISETWAQEMTRKWIKLKYIGDNEQDDDTKAEKLQQLEKAMKQFKVQEIFRKAAEMDGFFGRAHIYIDLGIDSNDRAELKTPIGNTQDRLSRGKVKKGSLKRFKVIEPIWTYPNAYNSNDPLRDDFFVPSTWFVMGKEIHASRLLTFVGRPVPDLLKPMYSFGGLALSQICKPYVDNWLRTRQSVSDAISNFSIMIMMTDMSSMLQDGALMELGTRVDLFNAARDNRGLMLVDKSSEDLKNVSMPLGTLDHLQAQSQEHMSSVSQIPLVKLTGISPSGLNATSEQEVRVFDDKVEAQQEAFFTPNLSKVINVLQLHLWGEIDPNIGFEYEKLYGLDEGEEAEMFKTKVDTDGALIDRGVISPQEARVRLASEADSPYASLDTSPEALPTPPQQPGQESDEEGSLSDLLNGAAGGEGGEQKPGAQQTPIPRNRIVQPSAAAPAGHDENDNHDEHGRFASNGTVSTKLGTIHFHDWSDWGDADDKDTSNSMYKYGLQAHRVRTCKTCGQKQYEVGAHDEMLVIDEAPANIEVHRAALGGPEPKLRAAGILYSDGSHILLLRRSNNGDAAGQWALPGGKIEDGETPHAAAARESYEETGHYPKLVKQLHTTDDTSPVHFTTFLAPTQKFTPQLNGEHTAHKWVTPEDARDMNLHPGVRSMLDHMMATDGWNEQEHPRGQPDNAGEFASKGEEEEGSTDPEKAFGAAENAGVPEKARAVTQTPEFKKWFGTSKVVNPDGSPKVMYHGTGDVFDKFHRRVGDVGMHFGTAGQANDRLAYVIERHPEKLKTGHYNIMPVYLNIRYPVRLTDAGTWNAENMVYQLQKMFPSDGLSDKPNVWDNDKKEWKPAKTVLKTPADIRKYLQSKGYDGIVYKNTGEVGGSGQLRREAMFDADKNRELKDYIDKHAEDSWVAFEPNQIKSATGNKGTFKKSSGVITDSALGEDAGEWDESKHPRGQPGNAGEFASEPGGGRETPVRIKLKGSTPEGAQKAKDFMNAVAKSGYINPINPREIIMGGAGVELHRNTDGSVHINFIRSLEQGKGHASAALKKITDMADKAGITLNLDVSPQPHHAPDKKAALSGKQLADWYGRNGFEPIHKRGERGLMERKPGAEHAEAAPERKRIQSRTQIPRKVLFEVAPDPNNKELSSRWNTLDSNTRTQISSKVLNDILPEVLKTVGGGKPVKADMHMQYGGYLEDTNPSMSLVLGKGVNDDQADLLTRALGAILSQDSMARVSKKPFKDSFEMGVVAVSVPKNIAYSDVKKLYDTLRDKVRAPNGDSLINGHTTDAGSMMILVDKGTEADIAKQVDAALGGKHDVGHDVVNVAWPEKGEDNYGFTGKGGHSGSGTGSSVRAWIDSVHAKAAGELERYIQQEGQ